jgi:fluoroquinolone transport system permease protein
VEPAGAHEERPEVRTIQVIRALGPVDARSVTRDSMLRWVVILAPVLALQYRFLVPAVTDWLARSFELDLVPYYGLLMSFVGIIFPGFLGTVIGFLLLDQRDDETLPALLVTPMSLGDHLGYRLALPSALGLAFTLLMYPVAGFTTFTFPQILASSLCAAPLTTLYALFLGTFAANKVQGFALAKAVGVLFIPAVMAHFVGPFWKFPCALAPHYWPLKVYWLFDAGVDTQAWLFTLIGLAYQSLLLWLLARRFAHAVRR